MDDLEEYVSRLEELAVRVDEFPDDQRETVLELLDGIDALHRTAVLEMAAALSDGTAEALRDAHPAIAWLFDIYGVGIDERSAAESALDPIRPYVESHGGNVEVVDVTRGVVTVELSGACSGCTASAATLTQGVEEALRENFPGFVAMQAVEDTTAAPHPPPPTSLVQITPRPALLPVDAET